MDTIRVCVGCGTTLAQDAPQGLCPQCLLKAGMETKGSPAGGTEAFVAPDPAQLSADFPQLEILEPGVRTRPEVVQVRSRSVARDGAILDSERRGAVRRLPALERAAVEERYPGVFVGRRLRGAGALRQKSGADQEDGSEDAHGMTPWGTARQHRTRSGRQAPATVPYRGQIVTDQRCWWPDGSGRAGRGTHVGSTLS